ncbi:MAG: hypothetical protein WBP94_13675 [Rhodomicrobiaceae bacterium]
MRIGFVYDLRNEYLALGHSELEVAEFDTPSTIAEIEATLARLGHAVDRIGRGQALAGRLAIGERWDLVFSIAEGLFGRSREAQVPALCEMFGQPYAFSDPLTMAATLDKAVAKRLVRDHGLPTAPFAVLNSAGEAKHVDLPFPLFVKPVAEGTGKGCGAASRVASHGELAAAAGVLIAHFDQPVICETFLPGREFTVGVLGTGPTARVIGIMEIAVRPEVADRIYSFENKEHCEERVIYQLADDAEAVRAGEIGLCCYRVLDCRDAGRVDLKLDEAGLPQFLELNPIAGLHPAHSDLPMIATKSGLGYDGLIGGIIDAAAARLGIGGERTARHNLAEVA